MTIDVAVFTIKYWYNLMTFFEKNEPLTFSLPYMTEISVNERNHKMTQIFVKYILHLCIFRHLKLEIALAIPASNDEK